jgi:adhesin/invasin
VTNQTSAGTTVPVIGERVYFSLLTANGGTLSVVNDRTGGGGVATAIYTAGNNMTSDTVRVRTDVGATASITIAKTGGILGARVSSLSASPPTVAADQTTVVTAKVTDGNSNPVQGETVTFTLPVNKSGASFVNAAGVHVSSVSINTDASGNAAAIYQAGSMSSGTAVQDTVQAVLTNGSSNAVVITRSAGTDLSVSVAAEPTSVNARQTSIITATVTGGGRSGAAVTFTIPVNSSGASFIDAGGSSVSSITLTASGSGIATAIYRAGSASLDTTVQDTVQAALTNGANGAVILTRTATAPTPTTYAVSIGVPSTPVTAGQVSVITATVTSGTTAPPATPVAGITVTFTLPVNNSGATLSASSAVTDGNGKAVVTYTAGSANPTLTVYDTVLAVVDSVSSTAVITRTGMETLSIKINADPASLSAGQVSIITATVTGGTGSGTNEAVTLTIPVNNSGASFRNAAGASVSMVTITTGSGGTASAIYQVGTNSASTSVQDTVQGVLSNGALSAVTITRSAGVAGYILTVTANPAALTTQTGSSLVTASLKDNLGTAVVGNGVTFSQSCDPSVGNVIVGPVPTNGAGNAVTSFTGGGTAGSCVVTGTSTAIGGVKYSGAVTITVPP